MRIGPARIYQHRQSLHDMVENNGCGYTGLTECPELPDDCFTFVKSQFARFNVPFPEEVWQIYERAVQAVCYYIDYTDPYSILLNLSDISFTDHWQKFTYEFRGDNAPEEGDPEQIETFAFVPGQAEHWFNHMLANPGLQAIPHDIGKGIEMEVECWLENVQEEWQEWEPIVQICAGNIKPYMELASWAIFVWIIGPMGRDWRMDTNALFDACITHGEAVLHEGTVIGPRDFKKVQRPPQSCHTCSLDAWCTEIIEVDGVSRYICEYCLNGGRALYPEANCGSRICKYVACPRHPLYSRNDPTNALYGMMRQQGGLLGNDSSRQLIA